MDVMKETTGIIHCLARENSEGDEIDPPLEIRFA